MSTDAPSSLTVDLEALPDDAVLLKSLVAQLFAELQKRDGRIEQLEHRLGLLLKKLYGQKSEKLDPRQLALFEMHGGEEPEDAMASEGDTTDTDTAEAETTSPSTVRKGGHGRRRLPDTLQRREVIHDLSDAEKEALGGTENLVLIGREVTEQLEWEPSCLYVIRHVQLSYARREQLPESGESPGEQNVITASKPPQPIAGGLPGPGLLAQVLTGKYADHIPLYRFERISRRHTGYFWTYVGDQHHPLIVFDYTADHSRDGPQTFLKQYRGYLQADAASVYDGLYDHPGHLILEVGCWMHARRNFFEARTTDRLRAETALARIGQLYDIERALQQCRDEQWPELPAEDIAERIAAERQRQAVPVLDEFHTWLDDERPHLLPKHPVRAAMEYVLSHWTALRRYTTDGILAIDNGPAERALRGIALGRKNWLFCGSDRGARAAAIHFSLIASCHRHGIDPFAYLRDILTQLPALGSPPDRNTLARLLPHRWQSE